MDLREAGVTEVGTLAVCAPDCGSVTPHRVGRQEEDIAVTTGCQDNRVSDVGFQLAGCHVAGDNATGATIGNDDLNHFVARVFLDRAGCNLTFQRLVGADQELLTCLATRVERTGDLDTTERAVIEQTTVFACERNALCDALVDDVRADLCQTVDVGFAGAVVTTLNRVVEEAVDGVIVVAVVLRSVDTTLRSNRVRATSGVLVEEHVDVVAHFAERSGSSATRKAGAYDDDTELTTVSRVHQSSRELTLFPAFGDWHIKRSLGVSDLLAFTVEALDQGFSHE